MIVLFFILCILSSGFTGNIYKKLAESSPSCAASALMPSVWYCMLAIFFGILTALPGDNAPTLLVPAVAAGVGMFTAAFCLIEAMKREAFSIPFIIINLNFVIPVLLSVVFLRERAGLLQLVGMVASAAVIVLLNLRGGSASAGASPRTMILLSVGACIANGLVNFFIRINEFLGGNSNCFFAVLYMTAAVCGIFVSLFCSAAKKISFPLRNVLSVRLLPWLMLLGACNGVCFYMTGRIAGYLNAAAQFTITTAASILLSLSVGILCRQEKLSVKILLSFLLCLAAVGCQALSLGG